MLTDALVCAISVGVPPRAHGPQSVQWMLESATKDCPGVAVLPAYSSKQFGGMDDFGRSVPAEPLDTLVRRVRQCEERHTVSHFR